MLSPPHDLDYALSHTHAHAPGATDVLHMLTETPPHTHTHTKKKNARLSHAACVQFHVQPVFTLDV